MTSLESNSRIRVLIVDEGVTFGGSIVVGAMLLRNLPKQEFDVRLAVEVDPHEVGDENLIEHILQVKHRVSYVNRMRIKQRIKRAPWRWLRFLLLAAAEGCSHVLNAGYRAKLRKLVAQADIVHSNNAREPLRIANAMNVMSILHCHALIPEGPNEIHKSALAGVHKFVAISKFIETSVANLGVDTSKIELIENPVETPSREIADRRSNSLGALGIDPKKKTFGIVGRIVEWKGQREFLLAAERILTRSDDWHAIVVGDAGEFGGDYMMSLQKFVKRKGLSSRVTFTGHMSDVDAIYGAIDVLVHASIEPEPFGLVITEAMARDTAVVVSKFGAPKEIVEHGVSGFVVDPHDTDELGEAVCTLLSDDELRSEVRSAARQRVFRKYSMQRFTDSFSTLYKAIMAKRKMEVG